MFEAIFVHYLHYGLHNNHVIQVQMYEMDTAVADSTLGPTCDPADERQGQGLDPGARHPQSSAPSRCLMLSLGLGRVFVRVSFISLLFTFLLG